MVGVAARDGRGARGRRSVFRDGGKLRWQFSGVRREPVLVKVGSKPRLRGWTPASSQARRQIIRSSLAWASAVAAMMVQ